LPSKIASGVPLREEGVEILPRPRPAGFDVFIELDATALAELLGRLERLRFGRGSWTSGSGAVKQKNRRRVKAHLILI